MELASGERVNAEQDLNESTAVRSIAPVERVRGLAGPRVLALVGLVLAVTAFAYRALLAFRPTDSIAVEVDGWFFEPSDTAPLIVVALSLWLLYRRAGHLAALSWQGGGVVPSGVLYLASLGVFAWALRTGASDLQAISLVLACGATAMLLGGWPALRVVWLPIAFLLFAVPIPSPLRHAIVWTFQIWTAEATGMLLYWLGIPAVVSGDRILLADNVFAIIETCSGLRSVITLSMLAVLMIDLFRRSGPHALLLLVATPFLAFATNALRSLTLVLNPASNVASVHSLQGIAMLLLSVLVLYGFDGLLERLGVPNGRPARAARMPAPPRLPRARLACVYGFLTLLAVLSVGLAPWPVPSPRVPLPVEGIPRQFDGWRSVDLRTDRLFLGMAALTGLVERRYTRDDESVDVFVASSSPRMRLRSFYSPKTALPGSGWTIEAHASREWQGTALEELVVRRAAERRLVHHWYLGTGGLFEETLRELLALDASPFARDARGVVVRLSAPIGPGGSVEDARARLERMALALQEPLGGLFEPPGDESG
jgi:EpsI family protein